MQGALRPPGLLLPLTPEDALINELINELKLCPTGPQWLVGLVSALQQLQSKPEQPELSFQGSARSSLALLNTPGAAGVSQSMEPFNGARTPEQEGEAFPPQHPLECETEAAGMARIWPCCIWHTKI